MTHAQRQRVTDVLAVKAATLGGVAVILAIVLDTAAPAVTALAAGGLSISLALWLRIGTVRSAWRQGYRDAHADLADEGDNNVHALPRRR